MSLAKTRQPLTWLVCLIFAFVVQVNANCKTHDAAWDPVKGPLVTQPSKLDPAKVKIDWTSILTNARCVDEYFIYIWKKNTPKETAIKVPVTNKTATSTLVEVEACVDFNFAVESVEHDMFRDDIRMSQATVFKSEAVPKLTNNDRRNFVVGYYYDANKAVHDLTRVSIRFPKSILEHASCIKHIEVKGAVDTHYQAPGTGRLYSQAAGGGQSQTHGYNLRSQNSTHSSYSSYSSSYYTSGHAYGGSGVGGSGHYPGGSGVGGSGHYPGGSGVGGSGHYPGGSGVGGSGHYPGGSGVGGSGHYPGGSGVGGSGHYPGGSGVGGSGSYPGGSGVGGSGSYPGGSGVGGSGSYPGGSGVGGSGSYPGGSGVGGSGSYPGGSGVGGSGSYPGGSGVGGSGSYPGGSGVGGSGSYPGGSGVGGSGSYPGGSGVGGSGSYPGGSGVGGSGSYPGGSGVGGGGLYPGGSGLFPGSGKPEYQDHSHTMGWHGKPPYSSQPPYPSHGRVKRERNPYPPVTTTTSRPQYSPGQPSVILPPPFHTEIIEVIVDNVEPCKAYKFSLKIVSPQNSVLSEIDQIILPTLPEIVDYHPPPLSKMFKVQIQGRDQPPIITLNPGFGVPATCLSEFFDAVDRHMQRLEADLAFHLRQESKAHGTVSYFKKQLSDEGTAQLKLHGCKCTSPALELLTNDTTVRTKFNSTFGIYHFDGMYQGKPFYRKPSRHQQVQTLPHPITPTPTSIPGYTTPKTTTTTTTAPPPLAGSIHYLYWDQKDKSWMVGETLGSHSPQFKTNEKSTAVCPGDPEAAKSWSHTSTFKWKADPNLKFDCAPHIIV